MRNCFTRCVVLAGLTICLFTQTLTAQDHYVSHFAGTIGGPGKVDGIGLAAKFGSPSGVFGIDGVLYVGDTDNRAIRTISLATAEVRTLATLDQVPCTAHPFPGAWSPGRVFYDFTLSVWADRTHVYVGDSCVNVLYKIAIGTGEVRILTGTLNQSGTVDGPASVARLDVPRIVSGDAEYLYIRDRGLRRVSKSTGETSRMADEVYMFVGADASFIYRLELRTLSRIDIKTGATSTIGELPFFLVSTMWVAGDFAYFAASNMPIVRMQLSTGETTVISTSVSLDFTGRSSLLSPNLYVAGWADNENIYFTQSVTDSVVRVSIRTGTTTTLAGSSAQSGNIDGAPASARFIGPTQVWGDASALYVADCFQSYGPCSLRQIRWIDGQVTTLLSLNRVTGIWGDGKSLYVAEYSYGNVIRQVDIASRQSTIIAGSASQGRQWGTTGDGVGTAARFGELPGLWGNGQYLFMTDGTTVRRMNLATREVTTLAGSPEMTGNTDGTGTNARFFYPAGIWGDGAKLYITDGSSRIRTVAVDTGEVKTLDGDVFPAHEISGDATYLYISPGPFAGVSYAGPVAQSATIRRIRRTDNTITTVAGSRNGGSDDGIGSAAQFNVPFGIWSDGQSVFVADSGNFAIRKLSPVESVTPFNILAEGGYSKTTVTLDRPEASVGYARIEKGAGTRMLAGTAIFGFRPNGRTLVSEAAVPAAAPIQRGRIPLDALNPANTGVAFANPNYTEVRVDFNFIGPDGENIRNGSLTLAAGAQLARFLTEPPFGAPRGEGTFTFNASAPLSVIALRGLVNERSEFLMTTLPVTDLNAFPTAPIYFPHFADGGGWTTRVVLINPSDEPLAGTLQFVTSKGENAEQVAYAIPPRGSRSILTAANSPEVRTGSIEVKPSGNGRYPAGLAIFSYRNNGVTVTEAGVPATRAATALRMYAESSRAFGEVGSIRTGVAIANPGSTAATVRFELTDLEGHLLRRNAALSISANGHVSLFLDQIPGFEDLLFVQGILRVTTEAASGISVIGLRGRYNERGDFLISTTEAIDENEPDPVAPLLFPHFVEGGGYTTQFVLFPRGSSTAFGVLRFFGQTGEPLRVPIQ